MTTNVIKQIVRPGDYGTQTIKMIVHPNERGPKGEKGDPGVQGPQGIPGPRGYDGAIHYRAGTGIKISDENIIYATGGSIAEWGGIQGDIADQTDLQNALNAKQNVMADFTGANGVVGGTSGKVPAPAATDNVKYLKGDGTWSEVDVEIDPPVNIGEVISEPTSVAYVDTVNIVDEAVTADKIYWPSTGLGETVGFSLESGVTLPFTAYDGWNTVMTTGSRDFSGGTYLLNMCSVAVVLTSNNYQAKIGYRIDSGEWVEVLDFAHFGDQSYLNGTVSFMVPVSISPGTHAIEICFGTNNASKRITIDRDQTILATLTKVGN